MSSSVQFQEIVGYLHKQLALSFTVIHLLFLVIHNKQL